MQGLYVWSFVWHTVKIDDRMRSENKPKYKAHQDDYILQ